MNNLFVQKTGSDLKKIFLVSIFFSLAIAIIGIVMYALPEESNKVIGTITGCAFFLSGINTLYKYVTREGARLYKYNIIFSILMILLGIAIIVVPSSVSEFITVCMGIYLVLLGSLKITYGIWFKIGNDSSWIITFIIGLMLFVFGVILIVNPFAALTLTQIVGIFLLVSSVLDITNTIMLLKRAERIVQIFW